MTEIASQASALAAEVARAFRTRVLHECLPRIRHCVGLLTDAQVWHRPNPACNAIGNLLLHLEGNVRQWMLGGLGHGTDQRNRPAEFAADATDAVRRKQDLLDRLATTVRAAAELVDAATPQLLLATHPFQAGKFSDTGIAGVLHVMEHFSGHAYQIYDRTKQLTGRDLRFYDL